LSPAGGKEELRIRTSLYTEPKFTGKGTKNPGGQGKGEEIESRRKRRKEKKVFTFSYRGIERKGGVRIKGKVPK